MSILLNALLFLAYFAHVLSALNLAIYYRGGSIYPSFINNMISSVTKDTLVWNNVLNTDMYYNSANLKTALDGGLTTDVLLAFNNNGAPVWDDATEAAVANALSIGNIKKLIVWDRYASNNVNVPDLDGIFHYAVAAEICPVNPATDPPSGGPMPDVGCWTGNWGTHGSVGCADMPALLVTHPEAVAYYQVPSPTDEPTHVHYCYGPFGADIMYSATPMDFYFYYSNVKATNYFINSMDFIIGNTFCTDSDGDGVLNDEDNCPDTANEGQCDLDGDGEGDACDPCVLGPQVDSDGDGVFDACDKCPGGDDNADVDSDEMPDACDICPDDDDNYSDSDNDGKPDCADNCPDESNALQRDIDEDGVGDVCDNCKFIANPNQADQDQNGKGNACDICCVENRPDACQGLSDGNYQKCDSCYGYVACSGGYRSDMPCATPTQVYNAVWPPNAYDDFCAGTSNTCPGNLPKCVPPPMP